MLGTHNSRAAKARRTVDILVEYFCHIWIYSRHLGLLIELFELGKIKHTKTFGTYRVNLIVGLFDRIIDMHNFELVIRNLSAEETACVYCRLGMLNIWNPMKPDGSWELDISRREERVIVKMLAQLVNIVIMIIL